MDAHQDLGSSNTVLLGKPRSNYWQDAALESDAPNTNLILLTNVLLWVYHKGSTRGVL